MGFLLRDKASQMYLAALRADGLVLAPSRAMIFLDDADIARAGVRYPSSYEKVELGVGTKNRAAPVGGRLG